MTADGLKLFRVCGVVTGSKYLGEFRAKTAEEAVEMALDSDAAYVGLCHQCAEECEDPEVSSATADEVTE